MVVARFPAFFLITILSLLLSACGGSGGGSSSSDGASARPDTTTSTEAEKSGHPVRISGYAVKGVVAEGIITAWAVESDGSYTRLGKPVRTSETGYYDLSFSARNDLIKLELTADGNTRMRCDAVDGCEGYAGSGAAAFGEDFWPGPNLQLETIARINRDRYQPQGHLTPLTTLSTTVFERMGASSGWDGFQRAQQKVEEWFGLPAGAVAHVPVDITRELPADLAVEGLEAALVNSAFLGLAKQFPVEGVQGAIDAFRNQLLSTGEIVREASGKQPGSESIRWYAGDHADKLADSQPASKAEELLSVAYRFFGSRGTDEQPVPGPEAPPVTGNNPPATGTATLTWTAPGAREDATPLKMGEIDQYIVRYGIQPDVEQMTSELVVQDGQAMEYEVAGLQAGTWYFAMRTVDQNGLESRWSEVASKTIAR